MKYRPMACVLHKNHLLHRKTRTWKIRDKFWKGQNLSIYSINWYQNVFLESSKRLPGLSLSNAGKVQSLVNCKSSLEAVESTSGNVKTRVFNRDASQGISTKLILMTCRLSFVKCR